MAGGVWIEFLSESIEKNIINIRKLNKCNKKLETTLLQSNIRKVHWGLLNNDS